MRSRLFVLLIIALLVMSLVPASVFAGKADPPSGMALRAGTGSHASRAGAAPPDAPVTLVLDDGGYENSIGLSNQVTNNAAVWFVRFTPTSSYPFSLNQIHILWPTQADAQINLVGQTVTLLVYTDTDGDGDPSNASLVYQQTATIVNQDGATFDIYNLTTPVALNGPGDVLLGFRDDWNLSGTTAANFPAAIDTTSSAVRSWVAGNSTSPVPDINNLANNDLFGTIDSFGLPGNWLIRGAGETAAGPHIALRKTVGTTAGVCATTTSISVAAGTTVYYCYTVTNDGDTTLNLHDLVDDQLGTIFTGFSYALAPGAMVSTVDAGLSISAVINTNTTNTGTWSAYNTGTNPVTAQASATVSIDPGACAVGTTTNVLYTTGFESGEDGWTHSAAAGTDTWAISTANPHTGTNAFHADDPASVSDQRLVSPAVNLPTGQNPITLRFWHVPNLEPSGSTACFDGGILEASTDAGSTWTQVPNANLLAGPYRGLVSSSFSNPLAGLNAWCGTTSYINTIADVSSYAGQTVQFRMRLGSDSSVSNPGWDVDDVTVQSCQSSPTSVELSNFSDNSATPATPWLPLAAVAALAVGAAWVARKRLAH